MHRSWLQVIVIIAGVIGSLLLGATGGAQAASQAATPTRPTAGPTAHPTPSNPWLTPTTRVDFRHPLTLPRGIPTQPWVSLQTATFAEAVGHLAVPPSLLQPAATRPTCDNGTAYPIWITNSANGQISNIWYVHRNHLLVSVAIYDCPLKTFWDTVFVVGSAQLDGYGITAAIATGSVDTTHYGAWLVVQSNGCDDVSQCGVTDGHGVVWATLTNPRQTLWDVSAQVPVWEWLLYGSRGSMTLHGAEDVWNCWGCRFDFGAVTPWNDD